MTTSSLATIDWETAGAEAITHLQALLRLDTRNPPGNERQAAEYLRDVLAEAGIESQIVGPSPERATLIARLVGSGARQPLLLMSHTDVVAVEPERWDHDPFGGVIDDENWLYGRGALDMKNMVVMELMAMLLLKRAGLPLDRDVIFMAAADEETGGQQGAGWVVEHHPELIQAEYALNEGGGSISDINGVRYISVQTAEKGTARFRIRTTGAPGHGATPHDDNAVTRLASIVARLAATPTPVHLTASLRAYIEGVAAVQPPAVAAQLRAVVADEGGTDAAIAQLPVDAQFKHRLRALVRNTIAPTMLLAGAQINVIPSQAEARFDGRILPGWTTEQFADEIRAIVGADIDIEFIAPSPPLEADHRSPLFDVITAVLAEHAPEATPVPTMLAGATDAKHVAALGTKIYGFAPGLDGPSEGARIHGHNERVSTGSLRWGTRVLTEVVARFAGEG